MLNEKWKNYSISFLKVITDYLVILMVFSSLIYVYILIENINSNYLSYLNVATYLNIVKDAILKIWSITLFICIISKISNSNYVNNFLNDKIRKRVLQYSLSTRVYFNRIIYIGGHLLGFIIFFYYIVFNFLNSPNITAFRVYLSSFLFFFLYYLYRLLLTENEIILIEYDKYASEHDEKSIRNFLSKLNNLKEYFIKEDYLYKITRDIHLDIRKKEIIFNKCNNSEKNKYWNNIITNLKNNSDDELDKNFYEFINIYNPNKENIIIYDYPFKYKAKKFIVTNLMKIISIILVAGIYIIIGQKNIPNLILELLSNYS